MHEAISQTTSPERTEDTRYQPPTFEVICLACEISAYAPDVTAT